MWLSALSLRHGSTIPLLAGGAKHGAKITIFSQTGGSGGRKAENMWADGWGSGVFPTIPAPFGLLLPVPSQKVGKKFCTYRK